MEKKLWMVWDKDLRCFVWWDFDKSDMEEWIKGSVQETTRIRIGYIPVDAGEEDVVKGKDFYCKRDDIEWALGRLKGCTL